MLLHVLYRIQNSSDASHSNSLNYFPLSIDDDDLVSLKTIQSAFSLSTGLSADGYLFRIRVNNGVNDQGYEFWDVLDSSQALPVTTLVLNNPEDDYLMQTYVSSDNDGIYNGLNSPTELNKKKSPRGLLSKIAQKAHNVSHFVSNGGGGGGSESGGESASSNTELGQKGASFHLLMFNLLEKLHDEPWRSPPPLSENAEVVDFNLFSSDTQGSSASPVSASPVSASPVSRAESLKKFSKAQSLKQSRRWDNIDQRWVVNPAHRESSRPSAASLEIRKQRELDSATETAKRAKSAVNALRLRQSQALQNESNMEAARLSLEAKMKSWSSEYGKKKALPALLASLHMVIFPEANWKPVCLSDLLTESKIRKIYLRASLCVHPDKTRNLKAEKRFVAARIFDALTQAKAATQEDNNRR